MEEEERHKPALQEPRGARAFRILNIPSQAEEHDVKWAVSTAYHKAIAENGSRRKPADDDEATRLLSVSITLHKRDDSSGRLMPFGSLLVPDWGGLFSWYTKQNHIYVPFYPDWNDRETVEHQALVFQVDRKRRWTAADISNLKTMPWHDPRLEKEHNDRLEKLRHSCQVSEIAFGFDHWHIKNKTPMHRFCVEWCAKFSGTIHSRADLEFQDAINTVVVSYGNPQEFTRSFIKLRYENIRSITVKDLTLIISLYTAPILEHGAMRHNEQSYDNATPRTRLIGLNEQHKRVISICPKKLRVSLYSSGILSIFKQMAQVVGLPFLKPSVYLDNDDGLGSLWHRGKRTKINPGDYLDWLSDRAMKELDDKWLARFPLRVSFQVAALLKNGLLNPIDIETMCSIVHRILKTSQRSEQQISDLLYHFSQSIPAWTFQELTTKTLEERFAAFQNEFWKRKTDFSKDLPPGWYWACSVTITPTTMRLEGPHHGQSNGVIRRYVEHSEHFLRVNFTDEERLQIRWDRDVDGTSFVRERVGNFLKNGFDIGGRHFDFLAYSNSGLREHSMWFVAPFRDRYNNQVNAEIIRNLIMDIELQKGGDTAEFKLEKQPAKFGARLAQAFSTTEPAIELKEDEVEIKEDIMVDPKFTKPDGPKTATEFTDGYGCMSLAVRDEIWRALNPGVNPLPIPAPAVFQVRLGGAKGVLGINPTLEGRKVVLHRSMVKFKSKDYGLHIAFKFDHPLKLFLNRPLIAILEHLGVQIDWFKRLLVNAQSKMNSTLLSIDEGAAEFFESRRLGLPFDLPRILRSLEKYEVTRVKLQEYDHPFNDFWLRCLDVAKAHIDRELKYKARIPVPFGCSLVGVPDVHMELEADEVYICKQERDREPKWFPEKPGYVYITRSPSIHPGDVQKFKAKHPPRGSVYYNHPVVNAVVFSCKGARPPASMLGGGDVDGDLFQIIPEKPDFKLEVGPPASYEVEDTLTLERPTTIEDIADFVVEYINSDKMGLVAIQHLILADQSNSGLHDPKCLKLAELHSKAVDFAKSGKPVSFQDLPKRYFPYTPDFQHKETRFDDQTSYYESPKALGVLYRMIKHIREVPERDKIVYDPTFDPVEHPITHALLFIGRPYCPSIQDALVHKERVMRTFYEYARELKSIRRIYTIGRTPLTEEEVVMGTILQASSQTKRRDDMASKVRDVAGMLVDQVRHAFQGYREDPLRDWFTRALCAWYCSMLHSTGYNESKRADEQDWRTAQCSFGMVALRSAFEAFDVLTKRRPDLRRSREAS